MGTPDFAVGTLKALVEAGHEVAAVVTQPDKPKGRSKELVFSPVKQEAVKLGIEVLQPEKARNEEFIEKLRTYNADIFVVVAFGQLLPKSIIDMPRFGCVNVHASLLPEYRGASPIQWAVIDGCEYSGVTTMKMDEGLDTGDIIDIVETDILCGETTGQLFERMALLGGKTIVPVLTRWVNGEIVATPQDDTMAIHTAKITKEMGQIDWSKPANEIVNLIRGLNPAPGCYTYLDGKRLKVWSGEVVPSDTTHCLIDIRGKHVPIAISATTVPGTIVSKIAGLGVFCGDGNIILLTEVQPENKKRISAIDFINGHQIKEGIVFGDSI